jgi:hypothetical protein
MLEFLLIISFYNIFLVLYLFNILTFLNFLFLSIFITIFILTIEKDIYLLFSKYKLTKKINIYDDKLNKKCILFLFKIFFKNKNKNYINNVNINSKIILNVDSDEE